MNQLSISLRPRKFSDIYNQPGVVGELTMRASNHDWPQAMLFKGSSGTGKTTAALITAMSINCTNPDKDGNPCCKCPSCMSIIEERFDRDTVVLDGSSFSGKDDVVAFGQAAETMPMYDRKKVLIIEEADQLSVAAKNAMLKLLEKPRDHVIFILLSMVNGGIPPAIQGRCQSFTFKPFTTKDVMMALKGIMDKTGVWDDPEIPTTFKLQGIAAISSSAHGSLREATQYYEKCLVGKYFTAEAIRDNLGLVDEETINSLIRKLINRDLTFFNEIYGVDISEFFGVCHSNLADAIVYRLTGSTKNVYYEGFIEELSKHPGLDALLDLFNQMFENPKPYISKAYFYSKMAMWFPSTPLTVTKSLKEESPPIRGRRIPV